MAKTTERAWPHDLDAEKAVIGAMLQKESLTDEVRQALPAGPDEFMRESHRELYDVLLSLYDARQPFDSHLIRDAMQKRGTERWGTNEFLLGFVGQVGSAPRAAHYAGIVHGHYLRRCVLLLCDNVANCAFDVTKDAIAAVQQADDEIRQLLDRSVLSGPQPIGSFVDEAIAFIQKELGGGLSSGFRSLDAFMDGLGPSELIIIGGRPSMGKSALLLHMADHIAHAQSKPVLLFALEMSGRQLAERMLLSKSKLPKRAIRNNDLTFDQNAALQNSQYDLRQSRVYVDDTSHLRVSELMARARAAHHKSPLAAVMVDYLQLVKPDRHETVREREVSSVSDGLLSLAKQLDIPVVAASQIARLQKGEKPRAPRLSDLRESGAIEQDAHKVILIHCPDRKDDEYEVDRTGRTVKKPPPDPETVELDLAKNRMGPVGGTTLTWHRNEMTYEEY